jgi:hypothetical protein
MHMIDAVLLFATPYPVMNVLSFVDGPTKNHISEV